MTGAEAREVVIVGSGPTGLAAARGLKERGIDDIVVLEREAEAGGIPRHCGHTGFGLLEFGRLMQGPAFARRVVSGAAGVELRTGVTVTALGPGGALELATPEGPRRLAGRRVLLATGARETPRPPRLVSGTRAWGVMTTGALQQFVYLEGLRPFRRAVIVGTELVSFSAIMTLRGGGMEPVAMIEAGPRITARRPGDLIARHLLGVPVLTDTRLVSIEGGRRVEAVVVEHGGEAREIACDGVVFTGRFRPEAALLGAGHLALDPGSGGPVVDQYWRCSDPAYYACGNLVHPVESAGRCYREGGKVAEVLAADLAGRLAAPVEEIRVEAAGALRYLFPQVIALPDGRDGRWSLNARAAREVRGGLTVLGDNGPLWSRAIHALPERRLVIPARAIGRPEVGHLRVVLEDGRGGRSRDGAK
jgi:NADPH-dependent 2,4-dienoyl-CoA reductase/sulfur reductase-like enzyme